MRLADIESEYVSSEAELSKTLGTLKYLKSIQYKKKISSDNDTKIATCPVCHEDISDQMAMLTCGHCLCIGCNLIIIDRQNLETSKNSVKITKCPTCRAVTKVADVSIVATAGTPAFIDQKETWEGENRIDIKGSFGTKIGHVVRRILAILCTSPSDKIIVFSLWKDALDILSHALTANMVTYLYPKSKKLFETSLRDFRANGKSEAGHSVLLLMLKQGGNGLNLQQAQHVIFLEPVLDPGDEAQAIGRVDRMGQSKPTFVHKFIVQSTIEENVAKINELKKHSEGRTTKKTKLQTLSVAEVAALLH